MKNVKEKECSFSSPGEQRKREDFGQFSLFLKDSENSVFSQILHIQVHLRHKKCQSVDWLRFHW